MDYFHDYAATRRKSRTPGHLSNLVDTKTTSLCSLVYFLGAHSRVSLHLSSPSCSIFSSLSPLYSRSLVVAVAVAALGTSCMIVPGNLFPKKSPHAQRHAYNNTHNARLLLRLLLPIADPFVSLRRLLLASFGASYNAPNVIGHVIAVIASAASSQVWSNRRCCWVTLQLKHR